MSGYIKLFSSILSSTIWEEDHTTRLCWITLLALCDRDGIVEVSVPGLAHQAHVTLEEATQALKKFQSPDPYSRSPEHEGRRIEPAPGGFRVLNHGKYRDKMSKEDLRERDRLRKQRYRRFNKDGCPTKSGTERDKTDMSVKSDIPDTDTDTYSYPTPPQTPPQSGDGVAYAAGVLQELQIPSSTLLRRAVGDAINFRCEQTGNPIETECEFIVAQATTWEASPDGSKVPRMSWLTWFQGKHYNDDPPSWRSTNGKGGRFADAVEACNAALYGEAGGPVAD